MQTLQDNAHNFDQDLDHELSAVYRKLTDASDALASPLQQLVRAQIDQAAPYVRAGVVLSAGINERDTPRLRHRRIQLAAALEMLFVAHNIHGLLLTPYAQEMDRSVMGSTILAGDFCFSHAAVLAAGTESPPVVAIFAQALKTVSEGNLRHLFGELDDYDENRELFNAGVEAAAILADLPAKEKEPLLDFCKALSGQSKMTDDEILVTLPAYQRPRWQYLHSQFRPSANNGAIG